MKMSDDSFQWKKYFILFKIQEHVQGFFSNYKPFP